MRQLKLLQVNYWGSHPAIWCRSRDWCRLRGNGFEFSISSCPSHDSVLAAAMANTTRSKWARSPATYGLYIIQLVLFVSGQGHRLSNVSGLVQPFVTQRSYTIGRKCRMRNSTHQGNYASVLWCKQEPRDQYVYRIHKLRQCKDSGNPVTPPSHPHPHKMYSILLNMCVSPQGWVWLNVLF